MMAMWRPRELGLQRSPTKEPCPVTQTQDPRFQLLPRAPASPGGSTASAPAQTTCSCGGQPVSPWPWWRPGPK